jgi:hypothetical protein
MITINSTGRSRLPNGTVVVVVMVDVVTEVGPVVGAVVTTGVVVLEVRVDVVSVGIMTSSM